MSDDMKLLAILLLAIGSLLWWYGYKVVQRLEILIRRAGGVVPGDKD